MDLPEWVDIAIIIACVLLALTAIWMLFACSRVATESGEEAVERSPFDPMFLGSALVVIALAAIAFFLA